MRHNLRRIPIPLMFALAVAVGVAVTIIIQINVLAPPPAVVAPIETSATDLASGTGTYTAAVDVPTGSYAVYPTLAGLGKIQLKANTTGWYYLRYDLFVTVARRSTGDAVFTLATNYKVYVKEINATHAFVFYDVYSTGVVTKKVQVGTTGWYIYHPVVTAYDTATKNAITSLLNSLALTQAYVFQPKSDYVVYDPNLKTYYVYFDTIDNTGTVTARNYHYTNTTSFLPVPTNAADIVDGIERIDIYNYVLYPTWSLLYTQPTSNVKSAFTITPAQ